jgi:hypothetical protein
MSRIGRQPPITYLIAGQLHENNNFQVGLINQSNQQNGGGSGSGGYNNVTINL